MIKFNFLNFETIYFVGNDWTEEQKGGYLSNEMFNSLETALEGFDFDIEDDGESPIGNCFCLGEEETESLIQHLKDKGYEYDPDMRLPKGAAVRLFGREDYDAPPPTAEDWKSVTLQCTKNTTGKLHGGHDFLSNNEQDLAKKRCSFCGCSIRDIERLL